MRVITLFLVSIFVLQCLSQSNRQFQWSFRDKSLSDLPTCSPLSIVVESFDTLTDLTTGIPPYYMISYPIGGMPITSLLGSDIDNLTWTPTHPLDSEVILIVVDSTGGSGGVSANPRKVVAGVTTGCIVNADDVDTFVVSANVSGSLSQCEPWGVTVSGGFPPYTVMLAETDSPVVANSSPLAVGGITFHHQVNLGGILVVAIADAQGQWASGTPVVHLGDSTDKICEPALPFTPSTASSHTVVFNMTSPSATPTSTNSGIITSAIPSTTASLGAPAMIQVDIAFQSPRTDIVPAPTSITISSNVMATPTPSNMAAPNSNSVPRPKIKTIALGLSIPLAIIVTVVCGVLGFCLYTKRRKRSINQQAVYQQPAPFVTASRVMEGYDATYNNSFEQRAFNARRDAKTNWMTGGADILISPSATTNLGGQSNSQMTLPGKYARSAQQSQSSALSTGQDPTTSHSFPGNDIEGPPDYRSLISESLPPR